MAPSLPKLFFLTRYIRLPVSLSSDKQQELATFLIRSVQWKGSSTCANSESAARGDHVTRHPVLLAIEIYVVQG